MDDPYGDTPYGVVAENFNTDGWLDLATATCWTDNVTVLRGDGDGTFGQRSFFATGRCPGWIVSADFNDDSRPNLATVNVYASTVSILLGTGDGTFRPTIDIETGLSPSGIAPGDFNGDRKTDLVTANWGDSSISLFLGQGNGAFSLPRGYSTARRPVHVVVADLDNDGKLDVAVAASANPGVVSVLLGRGDGTFGARTDFPQAAGLPHWRRRMSTKTAPLTWSRSTSTRGPRYSSGRATAPFTTRRT